MAESRIGAGRRAWHRALACVAGLLLFGGVAAAATWWWRPLAFLDVAQAWARLRAGLATRATVVGDHRWVYDERGTGDTLVLLHGFAGDRGDWYPLLPFLARRGRLLIPDLPGWGASQRRDDADYGARAQAARLADFLVAAGSPTRTSSGTPWGGRSQASSRPIIPRSLPG